MLPVAVTTTCAVSAALLLLIERYQISSALHAGTGLTVEGLVEHFHPMPWSGHDTERFDVQGVPFAYSDYVINNGFNHTSSHGGPIREGLPVRITYLPARPHNLIIKLEVAD